MRALRLAAAFTLLASAAQADITSHGVSAFGELKYPADYPHFDYVNPDAPKGGAYTGRSTFAARTFDSLNPYILKGEPAIEISLLVFESLMYRAWDEPDAMYGLIAESVTYPEDRSWAEFQMRPEAAFSDGTPVTADDVVFSLNILKEEGSPTYKTVFRDLASATALSSHRVRFEFRTGVSTRDLPQLAGQVPILSRKDWEGKDFAESTLVAPIGSGPYVIGEVQPGRSITYVKNPDYWGEDLPINIGKWNFGSLNYEYFKDSTAAFEAFKSGAFEMHEEFFSKLWATGYDFPAIDKGWVVRDVLPDGRPSGTQGYWFNLRRGKFQDPLVRQALALGFDFEWSNRTLFYDLYNRTDSFFEGSPLEATGMPSEAELLLIDAAPGLPESAKAEAFTPPKTDGSGRLRRLIRQAGKLLDQAGWTVGPDGVRQKNGETLSIEFLSNSPSFERISGPYIKNLKLMGVDAEYRQIDAAQYQQRTEDFDFDIVVARLPIQAVPGTELRNLWHSLSSDAKGSLNLSGVANEGVDMLIEAVIGAETAEEHATAVSALDRSLRAMHIWVPQWTKGSHTMAYWDKFGKPDMKPPFGRAIVETWWIDPVKEAALKEARGQ